MKFYNKETVNAETGIYYRRGDWGVERSSDWGKDNFTSVVPAAECLLEEYPAPCDWDEDTGTWIINLEAPEYEEYVRARRKEEYPTIGDQLDAIWKQVAADKDNGKTLESEADTLLIAVNAVKAKYPKE